MLINFYIARPTYCFILMYTGGLTVVIKRICYVMLGWLQQRWRRQLLSTCVIADWRHSLDLRADKRRSARTFCLPRRSQKYQRRLLPASLANTGRCDLDTVKSCYGNASVGPHRLRCRDRSIEFARWRQCALLSRTWVVGLTGVYSPPSSMSIGSSVSAGLSGVPNIQTDAQTLPLCL